MEQAAYTSIRELMTAALGTIIDIQSIEFKGVLKADEKKQQPFTLIVRGVLGAKRMPFESKEKWMPGKTVDFLARMGIRAIEEISGVK